MDHHKIALSFRPISCALLIVFVTFCAASPSITGRAYASDHVQEIVSTNNSSGQRLATKARVSLESKNFDLDEGDEDAYKKLLRSEEHQNDLKNGTTQPATTTTAATPAGTKKRKSARRFSDIWSMFLPGSQESGAGSDSDEGVDDIESLDDGSMPNADPIRDVRDPIRRMTSAESGQTNSSTFNQRPNVNQVNAKTGHEFQEGRLAAKQMKPVTDSGARQQGEPLQSSSSSGQPARTGQASSLTTGQTSKLSSNQLTATNGTTLDEVEGLKPVRLITGALSSNMSDRNGGAPLSSGPNMNEIVSNIMGSLSTSRLATTTVERESVSSTTEADLNRDVDSIAATANRTATQSDPDDDNFERWLNKIRVATSHPTVATTAALEREQSKLSSVPGRASNVGGKFVQREERPSTVRPRVGTDKNIGQVDNVKWPINRKRPGHNGENLSERPLIAASGVKGFPKRATQPHQNLNQLVPDMGTRLKYQSHPFQQQIRQQQAQLIHGIKYPQGQASTISVSTQEGASNTSLAFGAHYIPQINPINAISSSGSQETSQVVNSTQTPLPPHNHNTQSVAAFQSQQQTSSNTTHNDLSAGTDSDSVGYQSQDEILRQVTSAIHFEQQQLMSQQRRSNGLQQQTQSDANQAGETGGGDEDDSDLYMTPDGASRQLKSGQTNEGNSATSTNATSPLDDMLKAIGSFNTQLNSGQNQSQATVGSSDIDKSFELLAEKVRQLASQQQNLQQLHQQQLSLFQANNQQSGSLNKSESQQPSWLRAQQQLANFGGGGRQLDMLMKQSGNLTSLLGAAQQTHTGQQQQHPQQISINQMHDLLQKHERTKEELKKSQESMLAMMRQMMQLKAGNAKPSNVSSMATQQGSQSNSLVQPHGNDLSSQLNQMASLLNNNEDLQGGGQAPAEVSNSGWAPLAPNAHHAQAHQLQMQAQRIKRPNEMALMAPQSPANMIKNRVQIPNERNQQPQHHNQPNSIGLMLAHNPQQVDLDQTNEVDQRIIGLPIALLNNDEVELSQHQLEEAARLAAEQLGALPGSGGKRDQNLEELHSLTGPQRQPQQYQQQHNSNKFVPRVAQPHNRLPQGNDHLNNVQKLLQANSPQALQQLMMNNPSQARQVLQKLASSEQQRPTSEQQYQRNLMQLERLASLLPSLEHNPSVPDRAQAERESSQGVAPIDSAENQTGGEEQAHRESLKKLESKTNASQRNETSKLSQSQSQTMNGNNSQGSAQQQAQQRRQQQQQQQRQQQVVSTMGPQQQIVLPVGQYGQIPRPGSESFIQNLRPVLDSNHYVQAGLHQRLQPARQFYDDGPPPPGYTTMDSGGPPMKLHELTLRRPFGFRGHHSITYQASPVVADMFPRFVARPPSSSPLAAASRPSLLRHMTPIRATLNEGQRIISQILPPQLADHLGRYQHPYPTHYGEGQNLPLRHHSILSANPNHIRRATQPTNIKRQQRIHDLEHDSPEREAKLFERHHLMSPSRVAKIRFPVGPTEDDFEFATNDFDGQLDRAVLSQLMSDGHRFDSQQSPATVEQVHMSHEPSDEPVVEQQFIDRPRSRPGRQKQTNRFHDSQLLQPLTVGVKNNGSTQLPITKWRIDTPSDLATIKQLPCTTTTVAPGGTDSNEIASGFSLTTTSPIYSISMRTTLMNTTEPTNTTTLKPVTQTSTNSPTTNSTASITA